MSLNIEVDDVGAVLLADGWHTVANRSFQLDAYEYSWGKQHLLGGGRERLVSATGFGFTEPDGMLVSGPLTAVLAVRHKRPSS